MFRFLFTRRWLGLLLAVAVVSFGCTELGLWQFRRYAERHDSNARITANLSAAPQSVDAVMSSGVPPAAADEWRVVKASGSYDPGRQIAVLYRTRNGSPGVDLVVPLRTESGPALLVDRGWVATTGRVVTPDSLPAPPTGRVTITGWVRRNADGGSAQTTPSGGSVRAISSDAIEAAVPYDLYDGFVQVTSERPASKPAPALSLAPDLGSGPHFFYGLQWFFFAALAFAFWCYFAWSEYRTQRRPVAPPLQRTGGTSVDRQHHAGDVAGRR